MCGSGPSFMMIFMKNRVFSVLVCGLVLSFGNSSVEAQTQVKIGKMLNYKQPVTPVGADNYLYSTYYYNGKKAYNMKGFPIGSVNYEIISMKYNPAGSSFALMSHKNGKTVIEIYDAWAVGKVLSTISQVAAPTAMAYSADSRQFFVADAMGEVSVFDTKLYSQKTRFRIGLSANIAEVSNNGYYLALAGGSAVAVMNQETGSLRTTITARGEVVCIRFSEDATKLGVLTRNGILSIYSTRDFTVVNEYTDLNMANSFDFHPDGKYLTVLREGKQLLFLNMSDANDRSTLLDEDGGSTYVRYLKDQKHQIYLTYNAIKNVKYRLLKGLSPHLTKLLTDALNARMAEWSRMRPDETVEEYRLRVNEETRLQQARLFEQEIATELADDLVLRSEVRLGGYNPDNEMLTLAFDNMPQIFLTVPKDELDMFQDTNNLEFRNVLYGLRGDDTFEMTYAIVYNKLTGKSYEFNNKERRSLDYLYTDNSFVPIDLLQQTGMEDVKLQAIKEDVVTLAKQNNLISDHTKIQVNSTVVQDVDADGKRINNYKISFRYTVDGGFSVKEDFAAGKYRIEQSHAAKSMLDIVMRAFESDFAQYIKPGKKVMIRITGSADAMKINGTIPYDGCYGDIEAEPYYLDGQLGTMTITPQQGVKKNEQLAFLRAMGVKKYVETHMTSLAQMRTDYQYNIELPEGTGGEYRRINVDFTFIDAFQ